jgi:hypothetical protein
MDGTSLGVLIVGSITVIGLIQLCAWTVIIIKNPSFDYMRPEVKPAPPADGQQPR